MSKKDEKIRKAYNLEEKLEQALSRHSEEEEVVEQAGQQETTVEPVQVVDVSTEEMESMKKELEELRRKSEENFEGWTRERADFSNYKKRIERDQVQATQNITGNVIRKYLVILDDLERAFKARPTEGDGATWSQGVELIIRKLQTILENEGVIRIPAEQEQFDPTRHEAITHEDSPDHACDEIIEVVQQGYMLGERVLRPALVRVAR